MSSRMWRLGESVGVTSRISTMDVLFRKCAPYADDTRTKRAMPIIAEAVKGGCLGKCALVQGCSTYVENHAHFCSSNVYPLH
jgi:hypothetical protein